MLLKERLLYFVVALILVLLGLSTRMMEEHLPDFVSSHFGDALWAAMIYCGFRVIIVSKSKEKSFIFSLLFCIAVECSQLYQEDWINAIRGTVLGGLILGHGFLLIDLVRYSIGILFVYLVDKYFIKLRLA